MARYTYCEAMPTTHELDFAEYTEAVTALALGAAALDADNQDSGHYRSQLAALRLFYPWHTAELARRETEIEIAQVPRTAPGQTAAA